MVNVKPAFKERFSNQGPLKALYTHSYTHSNAVGGVHHARRQPARREQSGLRRLAQGHLDTRLGGAGNRTSSLPVTSQPRSSSHANMNPFFTSRNCLWPARHKSKQTMGSEQRCRDAQAADKRGVQELQTLPYLVSAAGWGLLVLLALHSHTTINLERGGNKVKHHK